MTETTGYLGNHPKSHLQHWSNQFWLRPRVTDRSFSEAEKFSKLSNPVLAIFESFFLYPARPVQISCILSVVNAWEVSCPKASFAKKKTSSRWNVFGAQHSLRNRSVLPEATMFNTFNRTINYLNAIFNSSLKCLKITYQFRIQSLCI